MKQIYLGIVVSLLLLVSSTPTYAQEETVMLSYSVSTAINESRDTRTGPVVIGDGRISNVWSLVPSDGIFLSGSAIEIKSLHDSDSIYFLLDQLVAVDYILIQWYPLGFNPAINSSSGYTLDSDIWLFGLKTPSRIRGDALVIDDNGTNILQRDETSNIYWETISPDETGESSKIEMSRPLTTTDSSGQDAAFDGVETEIYGMLLAEKDASVIINQTFQFDFTTDALETLSGIGDQAEEVPLYLFNQISRAGFVGAILYSGAILISRRIYKNSQKEETQ